MNDLVIRVTAYHGEPILLNKIPTRSGISNDTPVSKCINDPTGEVGRTWDISYEGGRHSEYDIDSLIADFQDEYGCKVNIGIETTTKGSLQVHEFDVFEPSWEDQEEAQSVIDDLARRLVDWVQGYPSGR